MTDIFQRFEVGSFLATVVAVTGSGYRRAGARMVFRADGSRHGSVSGGCLERDLIRHGPRLVENGPVTVLYDTRSEAFLDPGRFGTGCEGVIAILLQRFEDFQLGKDLCKGFEAAVLCQVWDGPDDSIGAAFLWRDGEVIERGLEGFDGLSVCIKDVLRAGKSVNLDVEDRGWKVLVEYLEPQLDLLIVGVGPDAMTLCALAGKIGFRIRVAWHDPLRFSEFTNVMCEELVHDSLSAIKISKRTAIVLMTHDLRLDARLTSEALQSKAWYVGLMGPKTRTAKIVATWQQAGWLPREELARLHTPVGLDLGGDSPDEVALSILSEIVAVKNGRLGGPLKDRKQSIHEPTPLRKTRSV